MCVCVIAVESNLLLINIDTVVYYNVYQMYVTSIFWMEGGEKQATENERLEKYQIEIDLY